MENIGPFKTPADFIKEIENLVATKNMEYIDAVLYFCTQNGLEIETVADLVKTSMVLKSKIQNEAIKLGMLQKGAKLPL